MASVGTIDKAPQLDEIVARLVAAFNPHSIVLFGSWATGNATADSDVDLLVIAESDEPLHVRMARAQRALRGLTVPVDVFVYTPAEVARFGQWLSHTVAIALREGRKLYAS
jgi:predicted nucleotidyltransferase